MTNSSKEIYRVCTQDKEEFYEEISIEPNQIAYYLFDSPHKPWKTFPDLATCKDYVTIELGQPWLEFLTPEAYQKFSQTLNVSQSNIWLNGTQTSVLVHEIIPGTIILIDTGKDWISLIQDPNNTFSWQPQKDPSYRNLGERLLTIQDALRKIDEMPIYIFENHSDAEFFFQTTFPKPQLIPLPSSLEK